MRAKSRLRSKPATNKNTGGRGSHGQDLQTDINGAILYMQRPKGSPAPSGTSVGSTFELQFHFEQCFVDGGLGAGSRHRCWVLTGKTWMEGSCTWTASAWGSRGWPRTSER